MNIDTQLDKKYGSSLVEIETSRGTANVGLGSVNTRQDSRRAKTKTNTESDGANVKVRSLHAFGKRMGFVAWCYPMMVVVWNEH